MRWASHSQGINDSQSPCGGVVGTSHSLVSGFWVQRHRRPGIDRLGPHVAHQGYEPLYCGELDSPERVVPRLAIPLPPQGVPAGTFRITRPGRDPRDGSRRTDADYLSGTQAVDRAGHRIQR